MIIKYNFQYLNCDTHVYDLTDKWTLSMKSRQLIGQEIHFQFH